jgi:AraC-like DNA-binding protein
MSLVRFSSGDIPESRRSGRYGEILNAVLNLRVESLDDAPLQVDTAMRLMSNGMVAAISHLSPLSMNRTAAHVADGNDNYVLSMPLTGDAFYRQRGADVVCKPGEAILLPGEEPSYIANGKMARLSLSIPRSLLDAATKGRNRQVGTPLGHSPALNLLCSYARALTDEAIDLPPSIEALATSHICDLLALALGDDAGNSDGDMRPGIRAARLQLIHEDILRNLHRHDLSLERVARRAGISARYVQAIFKAEGTTFREFVLSMRLERAHARLADPSAGNVPISEVAYSCGFGDLSYFNQTFRRRYAMTPSDLRRGHDATSSTR